MTEFVWVTDKQYSSELEDLLRGYYVWISAELKLCIGSALDPGETLRKGLEKLEHLCPPAGCVLLAMEDKKAIGIVALKIHSPSFGETEKMYVRPDFRKRGVGKTLLQKMIEQARQLGLDTLKLDSASFMKEAHALYRKVGFYDIGPYPECELPVELEKHWVFMELRIH